MFTDVRAGSRLKIASVILSTKPQRPATQLPFFFYKQDLGASPLYTLSVYSVYCILYLPFLQGTTGWLISINAEQFSLQVSNYSVTTLHSPWVILGKTFGLHEKPSLLHPVITVPCLLSCAEETSNSQRLSCHPFHLVSHMHAYVCAGTLTRVHSKARDGDSQCLCCSLSCSLAISLLLEPELSLCTGW